MKKEKVIEVQELVSLEDEKKGRVGEEYHIIKVLFNYDIKAKDNENRKYLLGHTHKKSIEKCLVMIPDNCNLIPPLEIVEDELYNYEVFPLEGQVIWAGEIPQNKSEIYCLTLLSNAVKDVIGPLINNSIVNPTRFIFMENLWVRGYDIFLFLKERNSHKYFQRTQKKLNVSGQNTNRKKKIMNPNKVFERSIIKKFGQLFLQIFSKNKNVQSKYKGRSLFKQILSSMKNDDLSLDDLNEALIKKHQRRRIIGANTTDLSEDYNNRIVKQKANYGSSRRKLFSLDRKARYESMTSNKNYSIETNEENLFNLPKQKRKPKIGLFPTSAKHGVFRDRVYDKLKSITTETQKKKNLVTPQKKQFFNTLLNSENKSMNKAYFRYKQQVSSPHALISEKLGALRANHRILSIEDSMKEKSKEKALKKYRESIDSSRDENQTNSIDDEVFRTRIQNIHKQNQKYRKKKVKEIGESYINNKSLSKVRISDERQKFKEQQIQVIQKTQNYATVQKYQKKQLKFIRPMRLVHNQIDIKIQKDRSKENTNKAQKNFFQKTQEKQVEEKIKEQKTVPKKQQNTQNSDNSHRDLKKDSSHISQMPSKLHQNTVEPIKKDLSKEKRRQQTPAQTQNKVLQKKQLEQNDKKQIHKKTASQVQLPKVKKQSFFGSVDNKLDEMEALQQPTIVPKRQKQKQKTIKNRFDLEKIKDNAIPKTNEPKKSARQMYDNYNDDEIEEVVLEDKKKVQKAVTQIKKQEHIISQESKQSKKELPPSIPKPKKQQNLLIPKERKHTEVKSENRNKTGNSNASSMNPVKSVKRQIDEFIFLINKMGQAVAKTSRLAKKLQKVEWYVGIYFLYKRFFYERKKIEKNLEKGISNLSRYGAIPENDWNEWIKKGGEREALIARCKQDNKNIQTSIRKMQKKMQAKSLPDRITKNIPLNKINLQVSKIAVQHIVDEYDQCVDQQLKLYKDEQILYHLNELINALYVLAELDGKIGEKRNLADFNNVKRKKQEMDGMVEFVFDLYQD